MKGWEFTYTNQPLKLVEKPDPEAKPGYVVIDVKAAITSTEKSQQNSEKNLRPVLPIYFSMMRPMDLPSFFTEAYSAAKS